MRRRRRWRRPRRGDREGRRGEQVGDRHRQGSDDRGDREGSQGGQGGLGEAEEQPGPALDKAKQATSEAWTRPSRPQERCSTRPRQPPRISTRWGKRRATAGSKPLPPPRPDKPGPPRIEPGSRRARSADEPIALESAATKPSAARGVRRQPPTPMRVGLAASRSGSEAAGAFAPGQGTERRRL